MTWGKEWPKPDAALAETLTKDANKMYSYNAKAEIEFGALKDKTPWVADIDFGSEPSKTIVWPSGKELKTQGSNLVDDQAYLYFQCEKCNTIFDPKTRSFATLNQKRFEAGWKVKWNVDGMGYKVYCQKCGDGK